MPGQLLTRDAIRLAKQFLKRYTDLPSTSYPMPRGYASTKGFRHFDVRYTDYNVEQDYVLMRLHVHDDRTVTVVSDRRADVRAILAMSGLEMPDSTYKPPSAFERLRAAYTSEDPRWPGWFIGIQFEPGEGHDAIATIEKHGGGHIHVPIVAWRSKEDKASFFNSPAGAHFGNRLGLIVSLEMTKEQIRQQLYAMLLKRR